ncbi:MAG TPA: diguanylate cyclase, partial [Roseiflexaceae bacterium]|nr:diguanylate cyclase [Roseiflexaceae bacterium]
QLSMILTAWPMPGGDGAAMLRRLRATPTKGYIYVILLTERDQQSVIIEGLRAGADDYLAKPLNLRELRRRVLLGHRVQKLERRVQNVEYERERWQSHDPLTGLLSRQEIYARAEAELARFSREGESFSLVLVGLDQIDTINQRYGFAVGDRALSLVGGSISQAVRRHDAVGRWRGATFLVVLPGTTSQLAARVAERIHSQMAALDLQNLNGHRLRIGVSMAMASVSDEMLDLPALVQKTEQALEQAQVQTHNRFLLFERDWTSS